MTDRKDSPPAVAVALHYDGSDAPHITAKGKGEIAGEILQIANEHDVPLEYDPQLAALLSQLPLGEEIPETLYRVVAEVIAFAYLVSGRMPPVASNPEPDEPPL